MQVIVKFLCVQVHIIDGVFEVLSKTFLEKFYLLCSLISSPDVCHSELRQKSLQRLQELLFMSDSSCKRVLSLSGDFHFPPILPLFF